MTTSKKAHQLGLDLINEIAIVTTTSPIPKGRKFDFDTSKIKALISAGADLTARNEDGFDPLIMAAAESFPDVVKMLIDAGAPLNTRDNQGRTALMHAFCEDSVDILIQAGADIRARDNKQKTAVMHYTRAPHFLDGMRVILAKDPEQLDLQDQDGNTPMICAILNSNLWALTELMKQMADPSIKNKVNCKALTVLVMRETDIKEQWMPKDYHTILESFKSYEKTFERDKAIATIAKGVALPDRKKPVLKVRNKTL